MQRLENILNFLRLKGWQIADADTKTLTAYVCRKVNTTMEIAFVDNMDHTIKRKDENARIDAIKIKSVKVERNTSIPRKEDMLNDLLSLTKQRVDIIYSIAEEKEEYINLLRVRGFELVMKNINEIKHLKYYCPSKSFGTYKPNLKDQQQLESFKGILGSTGSVYGEEIDKKYADILSNEIFNDKDIDFICMYLTIVKEYYDIENKDYGGIYDDEINALNQLLSYYQNFIM